MKKWRRKGTRQTPQGQQGGEQNRIQQKPRSIRSSQLVSPFGVGSIVDIGGESLSCMDISTWTKGACPPLSPNNLEQVLGKEIRRPIPGEKGTFVPFTRFPRWLFCPSCSRLYHWTLSQDKAKEFNPPRCEDAGCKDTALVPMRFVVVCSEGHAGDVDWYWWGHRNVQPAATGQCSKMGAKLYFKTTGASGGDFNAMLIVCQCGSSNTFEGLTNRPYPLKCGGRQPWQTQAPATRCATEARVHPRSASNVYYPVSISSIDIVTDGQGGGGEINVAISDWLSKQPSAQMVRQAVIVIGPSWRENQGLYQGLIDEASRQFQLPSDVVEPVIMSFLGGEAEGITSRPTQGSRDSSQFEILISEWPFLSRTNSIRTRELRTRPIPLAEVWPSSFVRVWEQVTLVERLREVRALLGFRRLKPDLVSRLVPVDLGSGETWLPGLDMYGEGIFLKFSQSSLSSWEGVVGPQVATRMDSLREKCARWGREPASAYASPRFIALHTFAHALVRRLAFDAGYTASSLRERIYTTSPGTPAGGILIYTSEGDSEGSLGGLVRQGEPDRLLQTLRRTLADISWCSGDPVCLELENQGIDAMNASACHACCLVSETSCMYNNSLLDRRLLVGAPDGNINGLLEDLLLEEGL